MKSARIIHPTFLIMLLLTTVLCPAATAQHGPHDGPNWDYDEHYSDAEKLRLLERKAEYELKRAASFRDRGIKGYKPSSESLRIALPRTYSSGIDRMKQLQRLYPKASPIVRGWIEYEFKLVKRRTIQLIGR